MNINKTLISSLLKDIVVKSLLPNIIKVVICLIIHWVILSFWIYNYYTDSENTKIILIIIIGGVLPILSYGYWGLGSFLLKSYAFIHEKIITVYIKEFTDKMAIKIINKTTTIEENNTTIIKQFETYIINKIKNLPSSIKRIIKWVLKRINFTDQIIMNTEIIHRKDQDEISNHLNDIISNILLEASENIMPFWVKWLILINIILFALIWFI